MAKIVNFPNIKLDDYEIENNDLFVRKVVNNKDVNTQIIVPSTHCAILIKDGIPTETLQAGKHPLYEKQVGVLKTKKIEEDVELIFVSKTAKLVASWGTPDLIDFRDPLTDIPLKMGASGEFEVRVKNPRKFYEELVGRDASFTLDSLKDRLRARMINEVEPAIASTMREKAISYCQISEQKNIVAQGVLPMLQKLFENEYALEMVSFIISRVNLAESYKEQIENELNRIKEEKKHEEDVVKRKAEAKEFAAEMERLSGKEFERQILMKKLASEDYEKYLDVCKIAGWDPRKNESNNGSKFCQKCGHSYETGASFCPGCGARVAEATVICSKCGKKNKGDSSFCSSCGNKL